MAPELTKPGLGHGAAHGNFGDDVFLFQRVRGGLKNLKKLVTAVLEGDTGLG